MRAILDPNVIISALLAPRGAPADVLRAWLEGRFDQVVSAALLDELERALAYPKLTKRITREESTALIELLGREAIVSDDTAGPPRIRSEDPGDDYLIALAERERAVLVSGDKHLLALSDELPVMSPRKFLSAIS